MIARREIAAIALLAAVFVAAPTPGDVGGCGKPATPLDQGAFGSARKKVDCERCDACGIATKRCSDACDPKSPPDVSFPATCRPLAHDGVVCLDALLAASCSDYATYVSDVAPAAPTECDFCLGSVDGGGE